MVVLRRRAVDSHILDRKHACMYPFLRRGTTDSSQEFLEERHTRKAYFPKHSEVTIPFCLEVSAPGSNTQVTLDQRCFRQE